MNCWSVLGLLGLMGMPLLAQAPSTPKATSPSAPARVLAYQHLKVGNALKVKFMNSEVGHCIIQFDGSAAPVMAANEQVGWYLSGEGKFTYRSVDPVEWAVMAGNLKDLSKLEIKKEEKARVLETPFRSMLLIWRGKSSLTLTGVEAGSLESAFNAHLKRWRLAMLAPLDHSAAMHDVNAQETPWVLAEIETGDLPFRYEFDHGMNHLETLHILDEGRIRDPLFRDHLYPVKLSAQTLGCGLA